MGKYIITWDAGFGQSAEVIEAKDEEAAREYAYENWVDEAESNHDTGTVLPYDPETAENLGAE